MHYFLDRGEVGKRPIKGQQDEVEHFWQPRIQGLEILQLIKPRIVMHLDTNLVKNESECNFSIINYFFSEK